MGILSIFRTKQTETLTYFIPAPPPRQTGYREKELDVLISTIAETGLKFKIDQTIAHKNGFWAIILISGTKQQFELLYSDPRFQEHNVNQEHSPEVELIQDHDDEFQNLDNYKI